MKDFKLYVSLDEVLSIEIFYMMQYSLLPQQVLILFCLLWVEVKIFYLAHCTTVPVNFDRGAARSGIWQIGNVIIFHLWSSSVFPQ
jgi:hypothetical protein